jgi:DNA-binding NtrC family response regulator
MSRVLVVDDHVGPREWLGELLKSQYDIMTTDNARAALDAVTAFRPDLIILDIRMPGGTDGLELLRRIKRIDPTIEVLMITAYASLDTVTAALRDGAFDYLSKPFTRRDLEEGVRRALARRHADA